MNPPARAMQSDYMIWAKTRQAVRYNLGASGLYNYPIAGLPVRIDDLDLSGPSLYGYSPLQEALSRHLGAPQENIVQTTGTSMANHLAMAAILEPGDDVLMEHPTYEPLVSTASHLGAHVRRFRRPAENGFRLDLGEVERALTAKTKLIVVTNLHNPSSAFCGEPELTALSALAGRAGARVLVDEAHLDAVFDLAPRSAYFAGSNIIATSSLTKVYGLNGLRCGWILADAALAGRIWRLNDLFGVFPAHPAERLSVLVLRHFVRIASQARHLLEANRALVNAFLASRRDLEAEPLAHGTVAFPRLLRGSVDRLCTILCDRYETTVVPGGFFEMPDRFRVGVGRPTEDIAEGLKRLGLALDDLSAESEC